MSDVTTIPIKKNTRDILKSLGMKGETYDKIIRRLVEKAEYDTFMEKQYGRLKEKEEFVSLEDI